MRILFMLLTAVMVAHGAEVNVRDYGAKGVLVLSLTSHGISPNAKGISMKTEWLERILATAKECGVAILGFDEL